VTPRYPAPAGLNNAWSEEEEEAFRQRTTYVLNYYKDQVNPSLAGEKEEKSLPQTMLSFLAGNHQEALEVLQLTEEEERAHEWTHGVDLFWTLSLLGQTAKFGYFGDSWDPDYQKTFQKAIEVWTQVDPAPGFKDVLLLRSPSAEVRMTVLKQLNTLWRSKEDVRKMAEAASAERAQDRKAFGKYLSELLPKLPTVRPSDSLEEWEFWASLFVGEPHLWMLYEEYERQVNPHPHPLYGRGAGPVKRKWTPQIRGTRTDPRSTINLKAMRDVALYVFAEAAEEPETLHIAKERIRQSAIQFWRYGNPEWDSDIYHAYTTAAYLNLYAFAQDPEVRNIAKGILDYLFTSAALKYRNGSWGGTVKRPFSSLIPFTTSPNFFWLYFGETTHPPKRPTHLSVYAILSGYRPPAAVVALARDKVALAGMSMERLHPSFHVEWSHTPSHPHYAETLFFGKHYQLGTLERWHGYAHQSDLNGFKLLIDDEEKNSIYVLATTSDPKHRFDRSRHNPVMDVLPGIKTVQSENKLLVLSRDPDRSFHFTLPRSIKLDLLEGIGFGRHHDVAFAIEPIHLQWADTARISGMYQGHTHYYFQHLHPVTSGKKPMGFFLEIRELTDDSDAYAAFQQDMIQNTSWRQNGDFVSYTATDGTILGMESTKEKLQSWRNDIPRTILKEKTSYWKTRSTGTASLHMAPTAGQLSIQVGETFFTGNMDLTTGSYRFSSSESGSRIRD